MASSTHDLSRVEWRRSTRTSNPDGPCIEVGFLEDGHVALRDSTDPDGPVLIYTPAEWDAFLDGAKKGEFDEA